MKISPYSAVFIGILAASAGRSQTPDFSGVYVDPGYVAVPAVSEPDVYPFTAAGREAFARFDPYSAPNQDDDCAAESMPGLVFNGDPMEMLQDDGGLVFHYERRDTRRTIHLDGAAPPADQPRSGLGYSVGRWVGNDELVIETTHLLDGAIRANEGQPLSRDARVTERYWREPGQRDLHVEVRVDDPVNYTETVILGRELSHTTEDVVRPWECVNLGPKDAEPDIDELVRMLEQLDGN